MQLKNIILSILLLSISNESLAEKLRFFCEFQYSLENFKPTREEIIWKGGTSYQSNLCEQKQIEKIIGNVNGYLNGELEYIYEDEFCMVDDQIEISVDLESEKLGIKTSSQSYWNEYIDRDINQARVNRKCDETKYEYSICQYDYGQFSLTDDDLKIWFGTQIEPDFCPLKHTMDDVRKYKESEYKDTVLKWCFYNTYPFKTDLEGNETYISIDRNTLEYTQIKTIAGIRIKNGEPIQSKTSGKGFAMDIQNYKEEKGFCRILNRKF